MILYLIDPHDRRLYNNGLFNPKIDLNFIVWKEIKKLLFTKKITLDTIDLHPIESAEKIFFLDHDFFSFNKNNINHYLSLTLRKKVPIKKRNLIISECPIIKPESWDKNNHRYYGNIFTWNDELVDNKKYLHYHWLQNLQKVNTQSVPFNKKKPIVLINAHKTNYLPNELYSLRIRAIRFFEKYALQDFDLFGIGWNKPLQIKFAYSVIKYRPLCLLRFLQDCVNSLKGFPSYKGEVKDKISTLARYKFCICFENMCNIEGYITEKIFDCFKANCIPVYYGASNISSKIPINTFIDYRQFDNYQNLYKYLINMNIRTYDRYLINIKKFLKSTQLKKWNYKSFCNDIFLK